MFYISILAQNMSILSLCSGPFAEVEIKSCIHFCTQVNHVKGTPLFVIKGMIFTVLIKKIQTPTKKNFVEGCTLSQTRLKTLLASKITRQLTKLTKKT